MKATEIIMSGHEYKSTVLSVFFVDAFYVSICLVCRDINREETKAKKTRTSKDLRCFSKWELASKQTKRGKSGCPSISLSH